MNILPSEQFEATDVDAGDQDNRCAGVDILNEVGDKGHAEIGFAAAHRRPLGVHRHFDVADISRAFGAQQLLAHILRSDADDRGLVDPYGRDPAPSDGGGRTRPAAPARDRVVRKLRCVCVSVIEHFPKSMFTP
jgi:hypothetical protein